MHTLRSPSPCLCLPLHPTGNHDYSLLMYLSRIYVETRKDHRILFSFPTQKAYLTYLRSKKPRQVPGLFTQQDILEIFPYQYIGNFLILSHSCIMLHCVYVLFIYGCIGSLLLPVRFLQLWRAVASLVAEHGLQARRLSSCGAWAQLLHGLWDLPGPRIEPLSPALAGGFLTTEPPGKSLYYCFQNQSSDGYFSSFQPFANYNKQLHTSFHMEASVSIGTIPQSGVVGSNCLITTKGCDILLSHLHCEAALVSPYTPTEYSISPNVSMFANPMSEKQYLSVICLLLSQLMLSIFLYV